MRAPRKRLYAGEMRDFTIEERLAEVAGLVSALSATELLLVRRLQQLRREMEATRVGSRVSPLAGSRPFDPRPGLGAVTTNPVPEEPPSQRLAPARPNGRVAPPEYVSSTPQWAAHPQESWPGDRGENASSAASTTRSYDYFAELDEKLAVLHQSGREARGG